MKYKKEETIYLSEGDSFNVGEVNRHESIVLATKSMMNKIEEKTGKPRKDINVIVVQEPAKRGIISAMTAL